MVSREEVGQRIRRAREQLNLSQAEFGRLLSPSRTHAAVSDMERGKTKLDVEELSALAMLLQKDLSYFFEEEQTTPSILYRRGGRGLVADEQRQTDRSLEAFKQLAREQARRKRDQQPQ